MIDLRHEGLDEDQGNLGAVAAEVLADHGEAPRAGAELDWSGVGIPETVGGAGGTEIERAVIAEAVGAALAADLTPWTAGIVAALLARDETSAGDAAETISALTGGALAAVPVGAPATLARCWNGDEIAGTWLALGDPDCELVAAPHAAPDGEALLLFARSEPGVRIEPVVSIDISRPYCRVTLEGVKPGAAAARAARPGLFADWLAHHCLVAALDAAGAARTALERTLVYAREREQFGRVIGSFQAYKHRCADLFIELRMAQSLAFRAARELAHGDTVAALSAGLTSTASATFIAGDAIQLHGGYGYTWEAGLHVNLKRARADEIIAAAGGACARALLDAAARRR